MVAAALAVVVEAAAVSEVEIVAHPAALAAAGEAVVEAMVVAAVEGEVEVSVETKSNPKIKSTSPDSPAICPKMTLQIFSAPLASSRLTGKPACRRSGSTRTTQQESRRVKLQSPTMILRPLKAPSHGSTEKTSMAVASKFRWP